MGIIHTLPSRLGLTRLWRRIHTSSVPVLLLHGVLPDADTSPFNSTGKFISLDRLKGFLERITRIFRVIGADEFVASITTGKNLDNAMLITFDDGYANNYQYAFPLLREMGLPFIIFVTTGLIDSDRILWTDLLEFAVFSTDKPVVHADFIGESLPIGDSQSKRQAIARLKEHLKTRSLDEAQRAVQDLCDQLEVDTSSSQLADVTFLTSDQIREMARAGVTFGGHTVTHSILSREDQQRVRTEVQVCKTDLEKLTGQSIRCFAYPNGRREDFNSMVIDELIKAGFVAAFTSIHGVYKPGDSPFEIKRISVDNRWSYEEFETRCSGLLKVLVR